eukprot:g5282.t1
MATKDDAQGTKREAPEAADSAEAAAADGTASAVKATAVPKEGASSSSKPVPRKRQRRNNISWNDIKVVQNLIERCVQQYMTQAEIVTALKVSGTYGDVDQIIAFNYLVDQHQKMLVAEREGGVEGSSSSSFLQQQQLMHLSQLQNMYYQQTSAVGGASGAAVATAAAAANGTGAIDPVSVLAAAAAQSSPKPILIPGSDQEPLSLDPNSLGSGGMDGKSILTPMVNAVAAAAAASSGVGPSNRKVPTHFFPPTPVEGSKNKEK